jgi:SAM-dependent methyltransferase
MSLNLKIRRIVPSTSMLTYHPVARRVLDAFDVVPNLVYKEFRDLPPNHLRVRVGVSNRLFANQVHHMRQAVKRWMYWFEAGWVTMESNIIDLGVGCGRYAQHFKDLSYYDQKYSGSYLGIDIDGEALQWCRENFDERFEFVQSTHESSSYINDQAAPDDYRFPREDGTVDFIFGESIFSHLLEDTAMNYLREGARVLRPGGVMAVSCFCVDLRGKKFGDRQSFEHTMGRTHVQSLKQPTAAVAYDSKVLIDMALEAGFSEARIDHDAEAVQQCLVATR